MNFLPTLIKNSKGVLAVLLIGFLFFISIIPIFSIQTLRADTTPPPEVPTQAPLSVQVTPINNFNDLIKSAQNLLNILIVIFVAFATVIFMYGLIKYTTQSGDAEGLKKARSYIIMGIIIITAMVSVYGLVNVVIKTFFPTDELLTSPTAIVIDLPKNMLASVTDLFTTPNSFAQTTGSGSFEGVNNTTGVNSVASLSNFIVTTINTLVVFLVGLGVFFFIFGLVKYATSGDDETKIKEARDYIVYGLLGIAIMMTVWGLVKIVSNTFFPNQYGSSIPLFK